MRCLGIDPGTKRVGLAWGDELGIATPLAALLEADAVKQVAQIAGLARTRRAECLVIGYPYNMDGSVGFKAKEVDGFIAALELALPGIPIERVDERLSSHEASRGLSLKKERELRASGRIDSAAAALLLQDFLDRRFPPALPGPPHGDEDPS
jgi:putative Holliday junction resolvase